MSILTKETANGCEKLKTFLEKCMFSNFKRVKTHLSLRILACDYMMQDAFHLFYNVRRNLPLVYLCTFGFYGNKYDPVCPMVNDTKHS